MEDMVDTDSAATEPTTLATVMEAMARGLLTLRLMPTTAMAAMVDTDSAMEDGYGGLGYGKRSADSEADAYYGYGGYGLGLYGKSAPCVNAANIPVPCTYGKRSADSDAYYGYGGA